MRRRRGTPTYPAWRERPQCAGVAIPVYRENDFSIVLELAARNLPGYGCSSVPRVVEAVQDRP